VPSDPIRTRGKMERRALEWGSRWRSPAVKPTETVRLYENAITRPMRARKPNLGLWCRSTTRASNEEMELLNVCATAMVELACPTTPVATVSIDCK
jgi:hypothetical protein